MNQSHILIVEDEKEIALAIEAYLTNQGYKVSLASNGVEALELVESIPIDLAIVDVMMPKMDGITFTMKLREHYHFPVIMLSAKSEEVDQIMGFNVALDGALGGETLPYPRHKKGYDFDNLIPFRMIHVQEKEALFDNSRQKYLHHRVITHDGEQYIQFFTKKTSFRVSVELDDGNEVPSNPDANLQTNLDSSGNSVFSVLTDKDELIEFFQLMKAGGGESTCFSATMTMMGKPAKYTDPETRRTYDAMHDTVVYSRANHPNLPKGVKGIIEVTYNIKHI